MRRNARLNQHSSDHSASTTKLFHNILLNDSPTTEDCLHMNSISSYDPANYNNNTYRFENTMEVKVEMGDTLQAIALRFHCTVADIRRLNKIDKDNEIHARNVVKIPVTVHNVLLDNLPTVQKGSNNSPKSEQICGRTNNNDILTSITRNPLEDAEVMLNEKQLVASVVSSGLVQKSTKNCVPPRENSINTIVLNSKLKSDALRIYTDKDIATTHSDDNLAHLITGTVDDATTVPQLHRIKGPSFRAMDWSGSDCDMSWICLLIVILSLCFVIPLVYVFYIAEHSHHNTTESIPSPRH